MRRRTRTNLWLAALAAALLIAGIETLRHGHEREQAEYAPLLALEGARALSIERAEGSGIRLERDGQHWRMTDPMRLPADPLRIERLLDELRFRQALRVDAAAPGAAVFGLDAPAVRVAIETETMTHRVAYGERHPIEDRRYAVIDDRVYLVEAELYPVLLAQELFLAEHYLLPRDFTPMALEYRGRRIPLAGDAGAPPLQTAWQNARALSIEAARPPHTGTTLVVEAADGRRIELRRLADDANLLLDRPGLGIRYRLLPGLARELLPPGSDAGAAGG